MTTRDTPEAALGEVIFAYGNNDDTRDEMFDWVRKDVAEAEIARLTAETVRLRRTMQNALPLDALAAHRLLRAALAPQAPR
jgi:hypothetical protein